MNLLYISKYNINGKKTFNERIGFVEYCDQKMWIVGLEPPLDFIIETYKFNKYIFYIDHADIEDIDAWDIRNKKVDIIVKNCSDEQYALYKLGTDYNLNIRVYFMETIEEYLNRFKV